MFIIQLVIIQVITFVALVFALRKIMYSASYMETRRLQRLNEENAKKAQELALKIQDVEKQCQEKLAISESEAKRLKVQAQEEIEKLKTEAITKAKQEGERIIAQALNSKDKIKEELEAKMQAEAINYSCKLTSYVLSAKNQQILHEGLLDDVLKDLANMEPVKFEIKTAAGELLTPYGLGEDKKEKMVNILSEKTGKKIILEEKINPEVIAGVIIKLASLIIDGSLSGKLKEAAEALKKG